MPSSGTVAQTLYRVADLSDSIARRCGVLPQNVTPEGLDVITGVMWRTLAGWSNRGINLWRVYHSLYPMYDGQQLYQLAAGDIEILNAVIRQPTRVDPATVVSSAGGTVLNLSDGDLTTDFTQSGANGNVAFDWGLGVTRQIGLIGLNSLPARTYNLIFEISNDGATYTQVLAPGSLAYAANGWKWYEIEPAGVPARYFRVRETGGAIISMNEVVLAENWSDIELARWDRDTWATHPQKRSKGPPRQYYFDRQITPQARVWPTPDSTQALNLLVFWIHRHIEDVGVIANTLNIPQRWYQPLVDVCAWLALPELPGADLKRYEMLKDIAAGVSLPDAEKEERDRGDIHIQPGIDAYTR